MGKFCEKLKFKTLMSGASRHVNFVLCSVFLFVCVQRSTFTMKLNRISRSKMLSKCFDEFVIFPQIHFIWQKCAIKFTFCLNVLVRKGRLLIQIQSESGRSL